MGARDGLPGRTCPRGPPQIPRKTHIFRILPAPKSLPHRSQSLPPTLRSSHPCGQPRAGLLASPGRGADGPTLVVVSCQVSGTGSCGEPAAFPEELANAAGKGRRTSACSVAPATGGEGLSPILRSPAGQAARGSVHSRPLPATPLPGPGHSWARRKTDGETEAQTRHTLSARSNIQLPDVCLTYYVGDTWLVRQKA